MMHAYHVKPRAGTPAKKWLLIFVLGLTACQPVRPLTSAVTPEVVEDSVPPAQAQSEPDTATIVVEAVASVPAVTEEASEEPTVEPTVVEPTVEPAAEPTASPELMAAGLAVYRAQYCGVCHELAAAGTMGTFGPPHNGLGAVAAARIAAADYTGAGSTPAEYIYESIVAPERYIVPNYLLTSHRMPPYGHLPTADLEALVALLLAQ